MAGGQRYIGDVFLSRGFLTNYKSEKEVAMPIYAVQRNLPGITMEELAEAQKKAIDTSNQFSKEGTVVKYIRSNFYPGDSRCTCLFKAPDSMSVKKVNEAASLPFEKIEEVLDLKP